MSYWNIHSEAEDSAPNRIRSDYPVQL